MSRTIVSGGARAARPGRVAPSREPLAVSISERKKEIARRRHRRKKLELLARRVQKATVSEKAVIAQKIRSLSSGCDVILQNLGLQERG